MTPVGAQSSEHLQKSQFCACSVLENNPSLGNTIAVNPGKNKSQAHASGREGSSGALFRSFSLTQINKLPLAMENVKANIQFQ